MFTTKYLDIRIFKGAPSISADPGGLPDSGKHAESVLGGGQGLIEPLAKQGGECRGEWLERDEELTDPCLHGDSLLHAFPFAWRL